MGLVEAVKSVFGNYANFSGRARRSEYWFFYLFNLLAVFIFMILGVMLGDSNRLEIAQMLSDGEKCGCRILERFSITQPTLSHHMKILVECGLVNDRKEGKWHHYSLNCEALIEFKNYIGSLTCEL